MKMQREYALKPLPHTGSDMQKKVVPNELLLGEVGKLISDGEKVTIMTKGYSMLPFITGERDSVLLEKKDELWPGMIALAQVRKDVYVIHRIIKIEGDRVTLMGDGNLKGCERCRTSDIVAVVTRIIKPDKEIECFSRRHLRQARIWNTLLPVRRWLLAVYRRLPHVK